MRCRPGTAKATDISTAPDLRRIADALRRVRGKGPNMTIIRHERVSDIGARETILDRAFGEERFRKSSERLREGRLPADRLSFIASEGGRVVGTARLWDISVGNGKPALLLGPVAVDCKRQGRGIGAALVGRAIREARKARYAAIVLVGNAAYYGRFGFSAGKTGALAMPGPFERDRLLGLELMQDGLDGARGTIAATGQAASNPVPAALVAQGGSARPHAA